MGSGVPISKLCTYYLQVDEAESSEKGANWARMLRKDYRETKKTKPFYWLSLEVPGRNGLFA